MVRLVNFNPIPKDVPTACGDWSYYRCLAPANRDHPLGKIVAEIAEG